VKLGVLAGAFNPVTRAHLALAEAALAHVDEVVCVTPRVFPHKEFHGATLDHRLEMLRRASDRYRVEVTEGGLFIDIARAFFQWGKYGQACTALRAAEQTAPQELAAQAPVRTLARNLAALAPPSTRRDAAHLADRIGAYS